MKLYLVRRPGLGLSLIAAESDTHMVNIIDEVMDPSECSWEPYHGPVWINFSPIVRAESSDEGVLRLRFGNVHRDWPLTAHVGDGETAHEMAEAVFEQGLPRLAAACDDPESLDRKAIRAAVEAELAAHTKATEGRGMVWDKGRFVRTKDVYMRWDGRTFVAIPRRSANDFMAGKKSIPSDATGCVRIVSLDVSATRESDFAMLATALRLRTDAKGRITKPHQADAFVEEIRRKEPGAEQMRDRRNEGVHWPLTRRELELLRVAVELKYPHVMRLDTSSQDTKST